MTPRTRSAAVAGLAWAKLGAFLVGVVGLAAYLAVELTLHLRCATADCHRAGRGFPVGILVVSCLLVAPFTIGQDAAAGFWTNLGLGLRDRIAGRAAKPAPCEPREPREPRAPDDNQLAAG